MLEELLWLYGAKRQYKMQKENGLAGIIGILAVILIVWKWDVIFYPIFNTLGLVDIFRNAGLVNENMSIITVINVVATLVFLLFLVSLITAVPMFLVMLLLNVFGNYDSKRPTAVQYALSLLLFPFALVLFLLVKPLQVIGVLPKVRKTLQQYVKEDDEMHATYNNVVSFKDNNGSLAELYAIQQTKQNDSITCTKITYDEVVSILNQAIPHLEANKNYAFGFSATRNQWFLLLNNPVPVFASKVVRNDRPEETPFNYKKLYDEFCYYKTQKVSVSAYRPHFFTPAVKLELLWNEEKEIISLDVEDGPRGLIIDVDTLDYFVKLEGESIQFFYEKAVDHKGVQSLYERAHAYAYIVPLAYPQEEHLFNNRMTIPSYYKELNRVPNTLEFAFDYQELVLKYIRLYAATNHKWALDYLEQHDFEQNNQ